MRSYRLWKVVAIVSVLCTVPHRAAPAGMPGNGRIAHPDVLLGMHFLHERSDCNTPGPGAVNVAPGFWDYVEHMPEDLRHMAYADFWHWWYEFERYKGDEKGMAAMDAIVEECLRRGMKVKVDLSWSTWWSDDRDWTQDVNLVRGPANVDDWGHLCDLLGRRYRGKIGQWLLQGEANTHDYWPGHTIEHVQEVYRRGSRAFKNADPGVLISVSGATPGEGGENVFGALNNRVEMDRWTRENVAALKGDFDDIPMNYFADVLGADPYDGMAGYFTSIRKELDRHGLRDVEVGSGESSFQWSLDSYTVKGPPPAWQPDVPRRTQRALSEEGQAWRCNEAIGTFFRLGGRKFMSWGTEFAPGGGWVWRWGLRKYQDWWGIWLPGDKVPGTNIVYGYSNPDGRRVDLRPGWTSPPTDPYHPIWQVYRWWAQACPPGGEAVRAEVVGADGVLATYLRTQDRLVALRPEGAPERRFAVSVGPAGWPEGTRVRVERTAQAIDYRTGVVQVRPSKVTSARVVGGRIAVAGLPATGFVTVSLAPVDESLRVAAAKVVSISHAAVGEPVTVEVAVTNGGSTWQVGQVGLAPVGIRGGRAARLRSVTAKGKAALFTVKLPATNRAGRETQFLRMRAASGIPFGPAIPVTYDVSDPNAPRKLVAHRQVGRVKLQWHAPTAGAPAGGYRIWRADRFDGKPAPVAITHATLYVDTPPQPDHAYTYHVTALSAAGADLRPSNPDNASAISKPRIWDAVVEGKAPERAKVGDSAELALVVRNTGARPWEIGKGYTMRLQATQLWGKDNEAALPRYDLPALKPGESVEVRVPFAAPKAGRFENHWIVTMEIPGKDVVFLGTPLLAETVVGER